MASKKKVVKKDKFDSIVDIVEKGYEPTTEAEKAVEEVLEAAVEPVEPTVAIDEQVVPVIDVDSTPRKLVRTFTQSEHGEDFIKLAMEFCSNQNKKHGRVRYILG